MAQQYTPQGAQREVPHAERQTDSLGPDELEYGSATMEQAERIVHTADPLESHQDVSPIMSSPMELDTPDAGPAVPLSIDGGYNHSINIFSQPNFYGHGPGRSAPVAAADHTHMRQPFGVSLGHVQTNGSTALGVFGDVSGSPVTVSCKSVEIAGPSLIGAFTEAQLRDFFQRANPQLGPTQGPLVPQSPGATSSGLSDPRRGGRPSSAPTLMTQAASSDLGGPNDSAPFLHAETQEETSFQQRSRSTTPSSESLSDRMDCSDEDSCHGDLMPAGRADATVAYNTPSLTSLTEGDIWRQGGHVQLPSVVATTDIVSVGPNVRIGNLGGQLYSGPEELGTSVSQDSRGRIVIEQESAARAGDR